MRLKEILNRYLYDLSSLYTPEEIKAVFFRLTEHFYQIKRLDLAIDPDLRLPDKRLEVALPELQQGKPWQYITGEVTFCHLPLKVNSHTLIPRPETEELVDWVYKDWKGKYVKILDIGTGSGAIAIGLGTKLPQAKISALDISLEALQIARENAQDNRQDIEFIHQDIFSIEAHNLNYDIIVSNPPYVRESEKKLMSDNVLKYEPANALFVLDRQALKFYDRILDLALKSCTKMVYFEINEYLKNELEALLNRKNLTDFTFKKDFFGKWRMLKVLI